MLHHRTDNLAERATDIAKHEADAVFERVWKESHGNFSRAYAAYNEVYWDVYEETLKELSGMIH